MGSAPGPLVGGFKILLPSYMSVPYVHQVSFKSITGSRSLRVLKSAHFASFSHFCLKLWGPPPPPGGKFKIMLPTISRYMSILSVHQDLLELIKGSRSLNVLNLAHFPTFSHFWLSYGVRPRPHGGKFKILLPTTFRYMSILYVH